MTEKHQEKRQFKTTLSIHTITIPSPLSLSLLSESYQPR